MCSLNNNNEKSNFCKSVYNCLILLSDTSCSNFWIWTEKWIACWLKLNRSDWRSILWKLKFWNYFFFLPCLPSVLEGYFHSITSFKLYMKKILQTILVWCCFLVPVLLYLILLLHVSAQHDVYIAIYWWQQKCVYRHWITSVVAELYDYLVNINFWILKKTFALMNSQGRPNATKWESANRDGSSNPYFLFFFHIYILYLTSLLYARMKVHVTIWKWVIDQIPLILSTHPGLFFLCVTLLVLMGLHCL